MKTRALAVVASLALATASLSLVGCGGEEKPPPAAPKRAAQPAWQDAFDGVPELFVVMRPELIKRDGVYGNLFRTLVRSALARERIGGANALELVEGSDEVIVAAHRDDEAGADDAAIVFRGVPASMDPAKLVDGEGRALFRSFDERSKVPEWVPASVGPSGAQRSVALFVLPDRTWVLATGTARARGRQAFANPSGRPLPKVDDRALAVVRLGPEFVQKPRYQKSVVVGPLVKKLSSATVLLDPGNGGLRLVLAYADDDSTAYAEMQVKRLRDALVERDRKRFAWLESAKISRGVNRVTVALPVPPRLLEELPLASPGDLGL